MGCLVELHNKKFVGCHNFTEYVALIQKNLIKSEDFGRSVHGKHSVNLFLCKGAYVDNLAKYAHQVNQLVSSGAVKEITFDFNNGVTHTLVKPFCVDVVGQSQFDEDTDPLILKFLCEAYRKVRPRRTKLTHHDFKADPTCVVVHSMTADKTAQPSIHQRQTIIN
jgi:hypothetical protein